MPFICLRFQRAEFSLHFREKQDLELILRDSTDSLAGFKRDWDTREGGSRFPFILAFVAEKQQLPRLTLDPGNLDRFRPLVLWPDCGDPMMAYRNSARSV